MLDYLLDLESDFRVFYRIDDVYSLDGPTFFALANRVGAYSGVIAARYRKLAEEEPSRNSPGGSAPSPVGEPMSAEDLTELVEFR